MSKRNRRNKSVSFNMRDAFEVRLLEHADKDQVGDFSKYIKRLIAFDMEGRRSIMVNMPTEIPVAQDEDAEAMLLML